MDKYINQIINADCLDVLKELPDKSIDLVLTDPPYNASNSNMSCIDKHYSTLNESWDKGFNPLEFLKESKRILKDNGSMLIFCSHHLLGEYLNWKDLKLQQIIHWVKTNPFPAIAKVYTPNIEYCVWFVKGSPYIFNKQYAKQNIITTNICAGKERINHPTQKPLELITKLLQVHSNPNDLILDCFSGSGTTAIACHKLNRRFICIEKDIDYYNASVERLENEKAQLKLF